jgi:flagellar FliJ protein
VAKKRSERLKSLLRLAQMREDNAARALAASSDKLAQARTQSQQLSQYSDEYQQQFAQRTQQAVSVRDLRNFQGFFRQLDTVQMQQQLLIEQRDREREQARQQWLQLYRRRRVLDDIRERARVQEEAARERKLQAEFDDRAARKDRSGY